MLALKGNQGTLRDDVELFFTAQKESPFKDIAVSRHQTLEKSHARIETRAYTALDQIDWLKERHSWAGLNSIVMVESVREIIGASAKPTRPPTSPPSSTSQAISCAAPRAKKLTRQTPPRRRERQLSRKAHGRRVKSFTRFPWVFAHNRLLH